jgi:hypothetical protein
MAIGKGPVPHTDTDRLDQVSNGWQYTSGGQPTSGRQYA